MVLTPRLCWKGTVAAARGAAPLAAFTAAINVRRWVTGVARDFKELRKALLAPRQAIGVGLRVEKILLKRIDCKLKLEYCQ